MAWLQARRDSLAEIFARECKVLPTQLTPTRVTELVLDLSSLNRDPGAGPRLQETDRLIAAEREFITADILLARVDELDSRLRAETDPDELERLTRLARHLDEVAGQRLAQHSRAEAELGKGEAAAARLDWQTEDLGPVELWPKVAKYWIGFFEEQVRGGLSARRLADFFGGHAPRHFFRHELEQLLEAVAPRSRWEPGLHENIRGLLALHDLQSAAEEYLESSGAVEQLDRDLAHYSAEVGLRPVLPDLPAPGARERADRIWQRVYDFDSVGEFFVALSEDERWALVSGGLPDHAVDVASLPVRWRNRINRYELARRQAAGQDISRELAKLAEAEQQAVRLPGHPAVHLLRIDRMVLAFGDIDTADHIAVHRRDERRPMAAGIAFAAPEFLDVLSTEDADQPALVVLTEPDEFGADVTEETRRWAPTRRLYDPHRWVGTPVVDLRTEADNAAWGACRQCRDRFRPISRGSRTTVGRTGPGRCRCWSMPWKANPRTAPTRS